MKKKLLGHCAVDSGQLLIADPCYLSEWKDGEYDDTKSHYGKACRATQSKNLGGELTISGIAGNGIAFSSGYGDGNYPVVAYYNKDGRITKVVVNLAPSEAAKKLLGLK